ncbi:hypothetical protein ABH920_004111 [Catenulispora sp. EB89]|uniref:PP2C family protein-serine/threonine phosphatase n=1 Tax=Catenulispora sp. EB89 TaxID=3156257 RepID=UPI003511A0E9
MNALTVAALAAAAGLASTALGELTSKEVRGRLDKIPVAILRLAGRRLGTAVRDDLLDEWSAELHEIMQGPDALPVTRVLVGTRFALGLLTAGPRIEKELATADEAVGDHRGELPPSFQQAMPGVLVQSEELRLAACYLPTVLRTTGATSAREHELVIRGGWYDTIPIDQGRTGLVVGNVVVPGTASREHIATEMDIMVRLRAIVRARASRNVPPAELLRHVSRRANALGRRYPISAVTTLVYCVHDAEHQTLTYANAGHIPPMMRLPNGSVLTLDENTGSPLDAGQHSWLETSVAAPAGSFVAFYTKGLLQRGVNDLPALLAQDPDQGPATTGAGPVDLVRDLILAAARPAESDTAHDLALMVAHIPLPGTTQYSPFQATSAA